MLQNMSIEEKKSNPYIKVYYKGNDVTMSRPLYIVSKNNCYIFSATNLLDIINYKTKGYTINKVYNQEDITKLNLSYDKYACCIE